MEVKYHRTAYVEVGDSDIFSALGDRSAWCKDKTAVCQTTENLKGINSETPTDSPLGEYLIELLATLQIAFFDGDVIFETEE